MVGRLSQHRYGKHRVRVSKIRRPRAKPANQETHEFVEVCVDVQLEGDFDQAYTHANNESVIATDTCKNTVYVLAKQDSLETLETFGVTLAEHFVDRYTQVRRCDISLSQVIWNRLLNSPHAFVASGEATPTARVCSSNDESTQVTAGIEKLLIAKTTESGFSKFHDSEFRTLKDTNDRILATEVAAEWKYDQCDLDFQQTRRDIVDALLGRFIDHYSHSIQETLHLMGQAALEACPHVESIELTLPNKHHLLANLAPFEIENDNEVFVVTDEPYGFISATITR